MIQKKLHITLLLILIWSFSFAQQYTNYTTKNGLPSNHVYRITQDYNGFIWFITDKGMVKFNGTEFKKYTIRDGLPTNDIWNIAATPNGKVWYFSKSPKLGYIDNDSIYAFPSTIKGEILNPMNRDVVGNQITFNNSFSHYQLENNQWKPYNNFGSFSKHKKYKTNLIHSKLARFETSNDDDFSYLFFNKNNEVVKKLKINLEIRLSHTRGQINDSIYIWLSDKSYSVINLNNYYFKTTFFKDAINIEESKYVRMHVVNNQIQITGKGFVSKLDKNYNLINTHYIPNKLKAHFSFIDKQDNLWIATFTNGVYKSPNSKQHAVYDLINEKVGKIKKIDNRLIVPVLDKGFYQYDSITKHFIIYRKETSYPYGVFDIKELNKQYYITSNKISTIHNGNGYTLYAPETHNYFNETARQLVFHKNYLYGNFTAGLNKLNVEDLSLNKEYLINGIRTLISFKNELIIATSNGLKILKNDSIQVLKFNNEDLNFNKKPILSLKKIDSNFLLVGTDSYGAYITDLDKATLLKETAYLSVNDTYIENNNLWLATDNGVLHYKKNKTDYIFINIYNENDGLLLKNAKSVYVNNNELIVSSNSGVVTIPIMKSNNKPLLDIYISHFNYNNKAITSKNVKFTKNNIVNFDVSSIDFSENTDLFYEYQLLPIQQKWISTSSKHISFNNLQPETYELRIRSKDKTNFLYFEILPLWYQRLITKIIFGLLFLSFLITVVLFIRKRELSKQKKKLNAQKKLADFELHALRSQMNPHFVFNSLNAIQYYLTKNDVELSEKYLVKFARLIRMFFDFSREKNISIEKEIKLLKGYLEIEKMRFGKYFNFRFIIDDKLKLSNIKIPTMLLQPIVENAVNHGVFHKGGKGLIEVEFQKIDYNIFKVIISDDGVGLKKSKEIQNKSLKNKDSKSKTRSSHVIKERIELLNQSKKWKIEYKLSDNSNALTGTTVQLIFTEINE